jgi:hypothetical protein
VNRADWQQMAEEKLLAADALLAASKWASAYYLAGFAVELGLKSCVLSRLAGFPELIFEEKNKKHSEKCWTHELDTLLDLAGLKGDLAAAKKATPALAANWAIVMNWRNDRRYEMKTPTDAQALYSALTYPTMGVMQWIKARW